MPKKRIKVPSVPEKGKVPRVAAQHQGPEGLVWAFRLVDVGGPWCWTKLDLGQLVTILSHLKSLETMSWEELGRGGSHSIPVESLSKAAQQRLEEIKLDDLLEIYSLRIRNLCRVHGIRVRNVIQILWWDPKHEVCVSNLRHT